MLVTDRVDASLRWANNSMTTNGESTSRDHHGDLDRPQRRRRARRVGALQRGRPGGDRRPGGRVAAARRRAAPEARDSAPLLAGGDAPADWDAPVPSTGAEVFLPVARGLARGFRGSDRLYGYARHILETTFVATSGGLRRRFTQPTGSVEINAKRDGASAWAGVEHRRLRRRANRSAARGVVDPAGVGAAHRRVARRPLRDDPAAVDGRRPDDLPDVDDGRPWRAGGPHRALGARRRHPGGGEADRPAADAVLRSARRGAGVRAVRGDVDVPRSGCRCSTTAWTSTGSTGSATA